MIKFGIKYPSSQSEAESAEEEKEESKSQEFNNST
jgi:hypothetical protein